MNTLIEWDYCVAAVLWLIGLHWGHIIASIKTKPVNKIERYTCATSTSHSATLYNTQLSLRMKARDMFNKSIHESVKVLKLRLASTAFARYMLGELTMTQFAVIVRSEISVKGLNLYVNLKSISPCTISCTITQVPVFRRLSLGEQEPLSALWCAGS